MSFLYKVATVVSTMYLLAGAVALWLGVVKWLLALLTLH